MAELERELRQHAGALRGLAAALVGGAEADDVVQETALQALRTPPREPGSLGGWLFGIVRHVASRHRRTRVRQQAREQFAVRDEAVPADGSIEAEDTLRFLTDAVLALPQPYRSVVFARYLQDLEPAAIAAQTGQPVGTVKTQLKRGLAMLRERFAAREREHGGDWRAGLVGAFGLERVIVATAAAAAGGIVMTAGVKWTIGVGAATLAVAGLWLAGGDPGLAVPSSLGDRGAGAVVVTSSLANEADAAAKDTAPSARNLAAANASATDGRAHVRGRAVDEHGAPLAGLRVELRGTKIEGGLGRDFEREYGEWLAARGETRWVDQRSTTSADGRFAFAAEPSPLCVTLWVQRDPIEHSTSLWQLNEPKDVDLGDLVVPVACAVVCRVVDDRGLVVATPQVQVVDVDQRGSDPGRPLLAARIGRVHTGVDGNVATTLVAGRYRWEVATRKTVRGEHAEVPRGATTFTHEVVVASLPHPDTITGIVVDERGAPLADVQVRAWRDHSSCACTDPLGRFTLQRVEQPDGDVELYFDKDGYDWQSRQRTAAWGERDRRFVMQDDVAIEVRAVDDERGEPVPDFAVRVWHAPHYQGWMWRLNGDRRDSGAHEHGIVRVERLPRGPYLVIVEPHRLDLWRSEPVPVEAVADRVARIDVRLRKAGERPLRVVRGDGAAVAKAKIELIDAAVQAPAPVGVGVKVDDIERWEPKQPFARMLLQATATDERGAALLRGPVDASVVARISGVGFVPFLFGPFRLDRPGELVATLPVGGTLVARVGPPELVAELRAVRERARQDKRPGFRLKRGIGLEAELVPASDSASIEVGADGTFTIRGAAPGEWQVALDYWEETPGEVLVWPMGTPFATVTLREGDTTEATFDLSDWLPGTITGLVRCNGELVCNESIRVQVTRRNPDHPKPTRSMVPADTDAEGRFTFRGRGGEVTVLVDRGDKSPIRPQANWVAARTSVPLPANGSTTQDFDVVACPLKLRLLTTAGQPIGGVEIRLTTDDGHLSHWFPAMPADGRLALDVEADTFNVQLGPARTPIGRVTAVPGGAANEIELRVPDDLLPRR